MFVSFGFLVFFALIFLLFFTYFLQNYFGSSELDQLKKQNEILKEEQKKIERSRDFWKSEYLNLEEQEHELKVSRNFWKSEYFNKFGNKDD